MYVMSFGTTEGYNVKINIHYPNDSWILNKFGKELASRIECDVNKPNINDYDVNYYINYAMFKQKSKGIDIALFTHLEEDKPQLVNKWNTVKENVDVCVTMSKRYEELIDGAITITPGIDPRFKPKLIIGNVGKVHARKGEELLKEVAKIPFVELRTTNGQLKEEELPNFYRQCDYTLITAKYEGGPMSAIESLACGVPIIIPRGVGFQQELPEAFVYNNSDFESLNALLDDLYATKVYLTKDVVSLTWDRWATKHIEVFNNAVSKN